MAPLSTRDFYFLRRPEIREMAEYVALSGGQGEEAEPVDSKAMRRRIASLDVFRGLSIAVLSLSLSLSLVVASLTGNCLYFMIR
ncbi:hypothetical protein MA16_Dca028889 [Dendrobium catenatum]|uniref:Uncharacterized protein n=1 Tax=Dendrobium catenatum TaxID=906689 RepID=A0A2I0VB11_9ASPA|nr:hypothetical protein MA16_Dca028889 [Dendrobium catenatum]